MKKKSALIFGITGQDGSYLAEFLLKKKYVVHGVKRRSSSFNTGRIDHLYQDPHEKKRNFILHYGDVTDAKKVGSDTAEKVMGKFALGRPSTYPSERRGLYSTDDWYC